MVKKSSARSVMDAFLEGAKETAITPETPAQTLNKTADTDNTRPRKERKTIHMQILITPSLKKGLQDMAAETGESMNELINKAIEKLVKGE